MLRWVPKKHKDWNDELVAKFKKYEKQSIMEQIRTNRSLESRYVGRREKYIGMDI